jgi:hypothetical protein
MQGARSATMFEEESPPPVGPAELPLEEKGTASSFSDPEPIGGRDADGGIDSRG